MRVETFTSSKKPLVLAILFSVAAALCIWVIYSAFPEVFSGSSSRYLYYSSDDIFALRFFQFVVLLLFGGIIYMFVYAWKANNFVVGVTPKELNICNKSIEWDLIESVELVEQRSEWFITNRCLKINYFDKQKGDLKTIKIPGFIQGFDYLKLLIEKHLEKKKLEEKK